jgi:peroxiredoxin
MEVATNAKIYLVYQTDGKKFIDSAVQENGAFRINGTVTQPIDATLVADKDGLGIQKILKTKGDGIDALRFYLHPGNIIVKSRGLIANATFPGSVINTDNEKLKALLKPITDRQLELSNQLRAGDYIVDLNNPNANRPMRVDDLIKIKKITKELDSLKAARTPVLKNFSQAYPNSYIALLALKQITPVHPNVDEVKQALTMYKRLSAPVKNTVVGKEYYKSLMDIKNLVAGTKAPDFTQNDTSGRPVSLASFKGKYVLIDFWASWCSPCRAENPALVKLYNDFKDKNFTILGVSLDDKDGRSAWLKAIKMDQLGWTQVSDLKHWDNEVSNLHSIRAIPEKILVDPKGIIVARGMNADQLRAIIEKRLP